MGERWKMAWEWGEMGKGKEHGEECTKKKLEKKGGRWRANAPIFPRITVFTVPSVSIFPEGNWRSQYGLIGMVGSKYPEWKNKKRVVGPQKIGYTGALSEAS